MKYFLIKQDPKVSNAPKIINWNKEINPANLKIGSYYKIKDRTILSIESSKNTVFTEIITYPFFLISKKIKEVIVLYEPVMRFKEIILMDSKNERAELYYMPLLEEIECIAEDSVFNWDHSMVEKGVLLKDKIGDTSIFYLKGVRNQQIVVRLDVLESLIRRNAILELNELGLR